MTDQRWVLRRPSDCLRAAVRGTLLRDFYLTDRQLQVLELLADGETTTTIAARLCLSVRSVHDHIHDLHTALDTQDRGALIGRWVGILYQVIDALGLHVPPNQDPEHARDDKRTGRFP